MIEQTKTRQEPARAESSSLSVLERLADEAREGLPPPRGECVAALLKLLHARTPPAQLSQARADELVAHAARLFEFLEKPLDGFRVRVQPTYGGDTCGTDGRKSPERLALETVGPDGPFLLDSLLELLRARGYEPCEVLHPIVAVDRDARGHVTSVSPPRDGAELVSLVHLELSARLTKSARADLAREAQEVLDEACLVVEDFGPMLERLRGVRGRVCKRLEDCKPSERGDIKEATDFLDWLQKANFVFLGYRGYHVRGTGTDAVLEVHHQSGLGVLRDESRSSFAQPRLLSSLPPDLRERILTPRLVLVHKANSESRVSRRTRMDYVGIKRLDVDGKVTGEDRFLGLFTARAYNDLPSTIPILRKKLEEILEEANVVPGSHDHGEIFSVFTSLPKYELFVTDTHGIAEMIFSIMSASRRRDVRVSYRPDFLERGVSVMVLLPRERFNVHLRVAIQNLLAEEFQGTFVNYRLALTDEPMARLHFYFATRPGVLPSTHLDGLEAKVSLLVRAWDERLREELDREFGAEEAARLGERYANAFSAGYLAVKSPAEAVADVHHADRALREKRCEASVAQGQLQDGRDVSVLRIYRCHEPFALSTLMPVLNGLGLHVLDEQTYRIAPSVPEEAVQADATPGSPGESAAESVVFLHSFRCLGANGSPLSTGKISENVEDTILGVLAREVENDSFNRLVASAGLDRRQVEVLRAYDSYLHQLGQPWKQRTTNAALNDNPKAAASLVKLFEARFDPHRSTGERQKLEENARSEFSEILDQVQGIIEDEILGFFEHLVLASVRTNYFRRDGQGNPASSLAIKFRCADVPKMPDPRPLYEIFVHNAAVEGLHLRGGKVARGGLRWSSRVDDYRMEILGLMKAQRTKNALIVPVGAKGGFILKQAPSGSAPSGEIRKQYEVFIRALLDVTDNVSGAQVVHPEGVLVHDEKDPYLVVAADRGTAAFSDVANTIATERSFWLGDAFASGGSTGYDHKKEGITARGAWECAWRHFRELGVDPDKETFTVTGVGDMSGDVFGNGMICSENIRLLAAFDHVHVFLDPDPDPKASFEERRRLFLLPRSSWTDYDPGKLSKGGGVYRRDAKSVRLSPQARNMLGIPAGKVNGNELIQAVLRMPVDLLFNGGIGTYVKARSESHQDVGDPANDAVRVDAADLQARIVVEGGNLGVTQHGRVECARAGGRINTDFIDNSAGVDLSDHEVNLKILLERTLHRGAITRTERDEILRGIAGPVCQQALRDNNLQCCVLTLEERRGSLALEEHRFLIEELSTTGILKRSVESIPNEGDLLRLRESGTSLTRPQLAVLLAYAKIDAYAKVLATDLPDDPNLERFLTDYFPPEVSSRFAPDIKDHALRREIIASAVVNSCINAMGVSFFHGLARRKGFTFDEMLRAFVIAIALADADTFFHAMDRLYAEGFADIDAFYSGLERFQVALGVIIRGVLRRRLTARSSVDLDDVFEIDAMMTRYRTGRTLGKDLSPELKRLALPEEILQHLSRTECLPERMDIADLAEGAGVAFAPAAVSWKEAGAYLLTDRLEEEARRIVRITDEDIQTCTSLMESAHESRRELAGKILQNLAVSETFLPLNLVERSAVSRILETARIREPLTPSGLFVVAETLGRLVQRVAG